jgi:uncharacterized protein YggU (UPF0235/DUF167 family)
MIGGVRPLRVRVNAGAKREKIVKKNNDEFLISVKEKAERNMANKRVMDILQGMLNVKRIKLVSGHRKQNKVFDIIN